MLLKPRLSVTQILRWADAYYARTGKWPTVRSGPVKENPDESWRKIGRALEVGIRGLPGDSSLPQLLQEYRGHRHLLHLPRLSIRQVLKWADAHHKRTGRWPGAASGKVTGAPGETWSGINLALTHGRRGLPQGSSLAKLLAQHRGRPNPQDLPRLTFRQILAWADAHYARTGAWPKVKSGPVKESPHDTWRGIHSALGAGARGLPAGWTLPRLLEKYRRVRHRLSAHKPAGVRKKASNRQGVRRWSRRRELTIGQILTWADAHQARTGRWPGRSDGRVTGARSESWSAISTALSQGLCGLPGGSSLPRLLAEQRGVRPRKNAPPLSIGKILVWADQHRRRHKEWPNYNSGPISGVAGETWSSIDSALRRGTRRLPAGYSMARLLAEHRGVRNRWSLGQLTHKQILTWADVHRQRTGAWPRPRDGRVMDAPGESWAAINTALMQGLRGLPGGETLVQLLARRRGSVPSRRCAK